MELHKSLDEYLKYDGFFAFESARAINTGLAFGAEQGNRIVGAILKDYMDKPFYKDSKMDLTTCPSRNTKVILKELKGFELNNQFQVREGIAFLNSKQIQDISTHHYAGSWGENTVRSKKKYKPTLARRILRSRKIMRVFERLENEKLLSAYQFLAYDFIEFGIVYYLRKMCKRLKKIFNAS